MQGEPSQGQTQRQAGSGAAPLSPGDGEERLAQGIGAERGPQLAGDGQAPSFLGFLGGILEDDRKTYRLGYLMTKAGIVAAIILVSVAAVGYVWMYKSPMLVKVGIGSSSTMLVTIGSFLRIKRAARRKRKSGDIQDAVTSLSMQPVPEQRDGDQIRSGDSGRRQDAGDDNPRDDLGTASHP